MNSKVEFNQEPIDIIGKASRTIYLFDKPNANIDASVVRSFGEEWKKFHHFSKSEIDKLGNEYFDIIDNSIVNKNTYGIDIGCGTGRFTKYLSERIGFIEAIDPSEAIFTADKLLENVTNVRLSMASTDNIPFNDETFDFGMSIGVLHHIPNTQQALLDCVKKVKIGGYFYVYLYYNLDNKGTLYKLILSIVTLMRSITSKLPVKLKKLVCDAISIFVYMPIIVFGRIIRKCGLVKLANKLPLSSYQNYTFYVIRNDALDRFGTTLEQRFSKDQVEEMMKCAGLAEIKFSENIPFWHALGKRIQ